MKKLILTAAAAFLLAASPAYASSCPKIMKQFDAAMSKSSASAESKAKATALRAEGEALHKAGKHAASVKALNEAMQHLGGK